MMTFPEIIDGTEPIRIDDKHHAPAGSIRDQCPQCKQVVDHNFADYNLNSPLTQTPIDFQMYCSTCDEAGREPHWTVRIVLDYSVRLYRGTFYYVTFVLSPGEITGGLYVRVESGILMPGQTARAIAQVCGVTGGHILAAVPVSEDLVRADGVADADVITVHGYVPAGLELRYLRDVQDTTR